MITLVVLGTWTTELAANQSISDHDDRYLYISPCPFLPTGAGSSTASRPGHALIGNCSHLAALTYQIKQVDTTEALLCTHFAHKMYLNHIHLSACWSSLGQLARQRPAERCWLHRNVEVLELLVQHSAMAAEAEDITAWQLANVAYEADSIHRQLFSQLPDLMFEQ